MQKITCRVKATLLRMTMCDVIDDDAMTKMMMTVIVVVAVATHRTAGRGRGRGRGRETGRGGTAVGRVRVRVREVIIAAGHRGRGHAIV
jgi:hypothetical protein